MRGTFSAALLALLSPLVIASCGADQPCTVASGEYRLRLPADASAQSPVGAVMYFHGWRGSAAGVMRNKSLGKVVAGLGLALIAPDGAGKTWSYPGSPASYRDEFRFVGEVLDDIATQGAIDPTQIVAIGFSMGGSMVWNLACQMGNRFQGFASISGAFWQPLPSNCPSPIPRLVHIHGMTDTVVPYAGRALGGGFRQGDVAQSINVWMVQGACAGRAPSHASLLAHLPPLATDRSGKPIEDKKTLSCERRYACRSGQIELCIHRGGHSLRTEWVVQAWRRLQMLGPVVTAQ